MTISVEERISEEELLRNVLDLGNAIDDMEQNVDKVEEVFVLVRRREELFQQWVRFNEEQAAVTGSARVLEPDTPIYELGQRILEQNQQLEGKFRSLQAMTAVRIGQTQVQSNVLATYHKLFTVGRSGRSIDQKG